MSRVLVVDDDPQLTRALRISLRASGYEVVTAPDGRAALHEAAAHHPDLVVLDLGLPDLDGTEVLAGLRPWFTGPVLVLSARVDSRDKVGALDAGADDYVSKPFDMGELLARLRALQRRTPVGCGDHLVAGGAETDPQRPGQLWVVVHDQDPAHGAGTGGAGDGTAAGRRETTIVRPPPGGSSAVTVPPIASVSPRATASPSPTP